MITELSAQNFKSWQDTGKLRFAPLTGFFGANSSGKSSILQILLMLKQTAEHPPEWDEPLDFGDEESLVDLRSFGDAIHRPVEGPSLGISVSWKLPEQTVIMNRYQVNALSFYFNLYNKSVGSINYQFSGHTFGIAPNDAGLYSFISPARPDQPLAEPYRCYGIIFHPSHRPPPQVHDFEKAFENLFARIHYLGPRREDPRRYYRWEESRIKDVGTYGEKDGFRSTFEFGSTRSHFKAGYGMATRTCNLSILIVLILSLIKNRIMKSSSNTTKTVPKSDSRTWGSAFPKSYRY